MTDQYDEARLGATMRSIIATTKRLIREKRFDFTRSDKPHWSGHGREAVTDVDPEVEAFVRDHWAMTFPDIPLIGEETYKPGGAPVGDTYATIDPLDGTEAFIRKQSHGIGSMMAVVEKGRVIAVTMGEVISNETYHYLLDHPPLRINDWSGKSVELAIDTDRPLARQHLMCGLHPEDYSPLVQALIRKGSNGGLCKDIEIDKGSIGTRAARLWKGEVGALLMKPRTATPWDDTPVIGFFRKLGFVFYKLEPGAARFERFDPPLLTAPTAVTHESLVIHSSRVPEFEAWQDRTYGSAT
jgi:fructose-1,6-bisphosphatase/inositol monophosphatase family enzyme